MLAIPAWGVCMGGDLPFDRKTGGSGSVNVNNRRLWQCLQCSAASLAVTPWRVRIRGKNLATVSLECSRARAARLTPPRCCDAYTGIARAHLGGSWRRSPFRCDFIPVEHQPTPTDQPTGGKERHATSWCSRVSWIPLRVTSYPRHAPTTSSTYPGQLTCRGRPAPSGTNAAEADTGRIRGGTRRGVCMHILPVFG